MKNAFDLNDFIESIEINGLYGRMINAPARTRFKKAKNLNILFVHGHHSSLERMTGVADLLMDYGNFCLPDMPGFGGMDHLYAIKEKPTIDSLADYMASFIRLRYGKDKKFVVVGYSMGLLVVTRMLQKYPHLQKQCIEVVSLAGLLKGSEIVFTKKRKLFYFTASLIVGSKLGSWVTREIFLHKWFLGSFYTRTHNAKDKFAGLDKDAMNKMVEFEVNLWRINHIPTWCFTSREMLRADVVTHAEKVSLPILSITVATDRYFDNKAVAEDMEKIYSSVTIYKAGAENHGGSIIETAKDALPFFPTKLRTHLKSIQ